MSETVSDKDVERTRSRVDKLRDQIAEEKSKASTNASDGANAIRQATLEREENSLKAELDSLKAANKPAVVRDALADATETPVVLEPEAFVDSDNIEVN